MTQSGDFVLLSKRADSKATDRQITFAVAGEQTAYGGAAPVGRSSGLPIESAASNSGNLLIPEALKGVKSPIGPTGLTKASLHPTGFFYELLG
jgi:hypothetical protein